MAPKWVRELGDRLGIPLNERHGVIRGQSRDLFVRCINSASALPPGLLHALDQLPEDSRPACLIYHDGRTKAENAVVIMRWPDFYKLFAWYYAARRELREEEGP